MYKPLIYLIGVCVLLSCTTQKQKADLIVTNANIYTVNDLLPKAEAFAVLDGKFIGVGSSQEIQAAFKSRNSIDAGGKTIVPGLIDGHCHFYNLGTGLQKAELTGTRSYEEVLDRLKKFQKEKNVSFIQGQGWDQNDWEEKEFPDKGALDQLFP